MPSARLEGNVAKLEVAFGALVPGLRQENEDIGELRSIKARHPKSSQIFGGKPSVANLCSIVPATFHLTHVSLSHTLTLALSLSLTCIFSISSSELPR